MAKIKIGLIGVGNNSSSLLQGIHFSKKQKTPIGILHPKIGKYKIHDIEVVAAFDVNQNKVGIDLSAAIYSQTNCTTNLCNVPEYGVEVKKGPVLDGLGRNLIAAIPVDEKQQPVNISETLEETGTEILVNFLPTGSKRATEFYAKEALKANCGFINSIPEIIASSSKWNEKFSQANLPLAGDDIKSQIGGTIVHRALVDLFVRRGVKIEETCQFNSAGNSDYLNLSDEVRYNSKLVTKRSSIQGLMSYETSICMPTPEYVQHSGDNRICHITLKGKYFGETPVSVDVKLNIEDSPNAAGSVIDVIRLMRIALDKNVSGTLEEICPFYFKYPSKQCDDYLAYQKVKKFMES
jgi:myo-inositol-1-phosphate synthase